MNNFTPVTPPSQYGDAFGAQSNPQGANDIAYGNSLAVAAKLINTLLANFVIFGKDGRPDLNATNAAINGALAIQPLITLATATAAGADHPQLFVGNTDWVAALPLVQASLNVAAGRS